MSDSQLSTFQKVWRDRAHRYGLRVEIPFHLQVGNHLIEIPVLLRDFGTGPDRGMLLVTNYDQIREYVDLITQNGYGYSCLSETDPTHPDDERAFIEMLLDWGWSGNGPPPAWLMNK